MQLNLVVLYSADIPATLAFYEQLGLKFHPEQHGRGAQHFAAKVDEVILELYPALAGERPTVARLGFTVTGLAMLLEKLTEAGVDIIKPLEETSSGWRAVVADPEGRRVELEQLRRRGPRCCG